MFSCPQIKSVGGKNLIVEVCYCRNGVSFELGQVQMLGYIYIIHDVLRKARGGGVRSIGGYPNHVKSLKGLVFKETLESCRWRSERRKFVIKPVD